jgi:hypothetical protein
MTDKYWHCKYHNWKQKGGLRGKDEGQQEFYAKMSSLAYEDTETRKNGLKKLGFQLDTELSNPDIIVAYNPNTKEVVHAFTGSRFTDKTKYKGSQNRIRDTKTDIGILTGTSRYGKRQKEVGGVVKSSQKKYGKSYNYTNTGHSKGSRLAFDNSKQTGIPAVGFNAGSSPIGAVTGKISKWLGRDKKAERIHYTTGNDVISISEKFLGDTKTNVVKMDKDKKRGAVANHDIENFTGQSGGKKGNAWIQHVKAYAKKNNVSYRNAMKQARASYKK